MRIVVSSFTALVLALAAQVAFAEDAKTPAKQDTKESPAKPTASSKTVTPQPKRAAPRADVSVGHALARLDDTLTLNVGPSTGTSTAAATGAPAPTTSAPAMVTTSESSLADIHVAKQDASDRAGSARDVTLVATTGAAAPKPVATVRMQRKMSVERTVASLATAFEACRAQAPAGASGTVAVQLEVAATGEVERADGSLARGDLGKAASACVVAAFRTAKFGAPGGTGAMLTLPVNVGQDRGDVTKLAISE